MAWLPIWIYRLSVLIASFSGWAWFAAIVFGVAMMIWGGVSLLLRFIAICSAEQEQEQMKERTRRQASRQRLVNGIAARNVVRIEEKDSGGNEQNEYPVPQHFVSHGRRQLEI